MASIASTIPLAASPQGIQPSPKRAMRRATRRLTVLRTGTVVELLTERDVIRHEQAVDPGSVRCTRHVEDPAPVAWTSPKDTSVVDNCGAVAGRVTSNPIDGIALPQFPGTPTVG